MKKKTPEETREIPKAVSEYFREVGRRGGSVNVPKGFAKMNPAERTKAARKGGKEKARRARERRKTKP